MFPNVRCTGSRGKYEILCPFCTRKSTYQLSNGKTSCRRFLKQAMDMLRLFVNDIQNDVNVVEGQRL